MANIIKENKKRSSLIEQMIVERIQGILHDPNIDIDRELFDIHKENRLIELKTCGFRVKDKKVKTKQFYAKGRFAIFTGPHAKLRDEAERLHMIPQYMFVIYEIKSEKLVIVRERFLSWFTTDKLVQKSKLYYTKKEKLPYVKFFYSDVFPDML